MAVCGCITPKHAHHDQLRVLGTQPGDDQSAPFLAALNVFNQSTNEGVGDGQVHHWAGRLGHGFEPPGPLRADLLKRRNPHRGMQSPTTATVVLEAV